MRSWRRPCEPSRSEANGFVPPSRSPTGASRRTSSIAWRVATTPSRTSGRDRIPRTSFPVPGRLICSSSRAAACSGRCWTPNTARRLSSRSGGRRRGRCGSRRPVCWREPCRAPPLRERVEPRAAAQAHPVARQDPALRGYAGAGGRGPGPRLDSGPDAPPQPAQRGRGRPDRAPERVDSRCHAGLGALHPHRLPARPAVRRDRSCPAAQRAGAAATVDGAVQCAGRPAHELQQHRRAGQPRRLAGAVCAGVLRRSFGRDSLSRHGRRARAPLRAVPGDDCVQAVRPVPPVPAGVTMRLFRWKAIVPLLLLGALVAGFWILFADRMAKRTTESVGTTLVGAKVEIDRMHLDVAHSRVEVRGLTVASPFEPLENLLQADLLVADLEPLPLLEKKLVIDRLAATGLRFGTPRQSDGRTVGQSDGVMGQVERWGQQLQVPALQLATGKISLDRLDPAQLNTPRLATALAAHADSSRTAWVSGLDALGTQAAVDSSARMVERLKGAKLTDVKLLGDARRSLEHVKRTEERLTALERSVTSGIATLQTGAAGLAEARQRDYALARGLLKLPGLDAPDIGAALFG